MKVSFSGNFGTLLKKKICSKISQSEHVVVAMGSANLDPICLWGELRGLSNYFAKHGIFKQQQQSCQKISLSSDNTLNMAFLRVFW
jgi:hypothetical protein